MFRNYGVLNNLVICIRKLMPFVFVIYFSML